MAGEWIKMECGLPDKPETLAITAAMGWDDPDLTVGKLMRLFRWFDQQTVDGNAPGVTPALLDRNIGVTGFVQAVANTGWLIIETGGLRLQNFDRHNGETAKKRALGAKRAASFRSNNKDLQHSNAASVTTALPREEKRREEKKETKAKEGARERALSVSDLVAQGCDEQHVKDWFAVRGKKGLTLSAWEACKREAAKAGISVPDAVAFSAERSWIGFNAGWYANANPVAKTAGTEWWKTGESDWWRSKEGIERKGREIGMFARGGEDHGSYAERIRARLKETAHA